MTLVVVYHCCKNCTVLCTAHFLISRKKVIYPRITKLTRMHEASNNVTTSLSDYPWQGHVYNCMKGNANITYR